MLSSCWKPHGTPQRGKSQHTGELFRETFLMWKSSLKTWLTQSSNLNSHGAVLDLFDFCNVLYVGFRYFLEFTFADLGFLLLAKTVRELSVLKGYPYSWITLRLFWGVCTCSNSIYTTISMPLYLYLVLSCELKFELYSYLSFLWYFD